MPIDYAGEINKARMLCDTLEQEENPIHAQQKAKRLEETAQRIHQKAQFAIAVNALKTQVKQLKEKGFNQQQIKQALEVAEGTKLEEILNKPATPVAEQKSPPAKKNNPDSKKVKIGSGSKVHWGKVR